MDIANLKEQAERCRRLAKQADPFTESACWISRWNTKPRIAELEPQLSTASRILRREES